jgi:hypothetical protein
MIYAALKAVQEQAIGSSAKWRQRRPSVGGPRASVVGKEKVKGLPILKTLGPGATNDRLD